MKKEVSDCCFTKEIKWYPLVNVQQCSNGKSIIIRTTLCKEEHSCRKEEERGVRGGGLESGGRRKKRGREREAGERGGKWE